MRGNRLLVIDDEPAFSNFVRRVAEGLGYEVSVTSRAKEFKAAYEDAEPGVILLDLIMPDVDGIELVNWLAERECKAKVLVVTGYNPHYAEFAQTIGTVKGLASVRTFTKPIRVSDLRAALS